MQNTSWLRNKSFLLLILFSLATIGVHAYLTQQHYEINLGLSEGKSSCNISATMNCDAVAASSYSKIFGVPVAILGVLIQLVILILLVSSRFALSSDPDRVRRYSLWTILFTALVSVVMGSLSTFALGTFCLYCMAAYALSFLSLLVAAFYPAPGALQDFGSDVAGLFTSHRWVLILLLTVPALGFVGNRVILSSYGLDRLQSVLDESRAVWAASPAQNFSLETGLVHYQGTLEPKMTIVEFADFRCIHCKMAYPTLHAFVEGRKDVKFIFKTFPLDGKCNKAMERNGDGLTCQLSAAAFCAEEIGQKGWAAHHWIFDRQQDWRASSDFETLGPKMAEEIGVNWDQLKACTQTDAMQEKLQAMSKEGSDAKIRGTPAIFVNGKMVERGQFLPVLEGIYRSL